MLCIDIGKDYQMVVFWYLLVTDNNAGKIQFQTSDMIDLMHYYYYYFFLVGLVKNLLNKYYSPNTLPVL